MGGTGRVHQGIERGSLLSEGANHSSRKTAVVEGTLIFFVPLGTRSVPV